MTVRIASFFLLHFDTFYRLHFFYFISNCDFKSCFYVLVVKAKRTTV